MLSAGPTPRPHLDRWSFTIQGAVGEPVSWTWDEFNALPTETFTLDIHCVTKWTKLDTTWTGVSVDTLLKGVEIEADYVTAWSDGDYTTNMTIADITDGKAWVVNTFAGEPLEAEHGGPARLLVPHLYFWKSAKWVRGLTLTPDRRAGVLGAERLPQPRRPVARAALLGRLIATRAPILWRAARVRELVDETPTARTIVFDVPDWPGHAAGQHVDVRLTAEDGYQTERSYSIASAPEDPRLALTVERIDDGEVSPYLTEELRAGDEIELRGPIGGYFAWRVQDGGPLLLVGGGSGVVPLMSMLRHHAAAGSTIDARLLLSARSAEDILYRAELDALRGVAVSYTLTRRAARRLGRVRPPRRRRHARGGRPGGGPAPARLRLRADGLRRDRRRPAARARTRSAGDSHRALRPDRRMR